MSVSYCPNAAELKAFVFPSSAPFNGKYLQHTFSSILAKGPPPPSPLPKTKRAESDDSRF